VTSEKREHIMDRRDIGAHRARLSGAIVAALLAAGVAACGGSGTNSSATQAAAVGTNASAATPATTSAAATTSAPAATSTRATGSAGANTSAGGGSTVAKEAAPGTALTAGQPANVSFQTTTSSGANGPSYRLEVTVDSIKKGSLKDFNGLQLDANEKASTPYYATVRITNVGPTSFKTSSNDPAVSVEGVDDTGNTDTSVTFFGTFPPCPDTATPNPLRAGQSFRTCLTYLVPGGITKVAYTSTNAYETSPVTWTAK
jgi:hypothetical protein